MGMAATALTGRGLLMAVRGHEEEGGGDSEGRGRENGHAEEGVPARVPYGGFVVPAVPVELARCPVCHSGAFTIKRQPAMATAYTANQEQLDYNNWLALPVEQRPIGLTTLSEYAEAHGVTERTLYRWRSDKEAGVTTPRRHGKRRRPYVTVPCPETAVVSCFTCGRDYLEYERGSREGWRKRPVRRWDGVILNDW